MKAQPHLKRQFSDEQLPSVLDLKGEIHREKFRTRYKGIVKSTLYALVIVAAFSVLVATLLLPVLKIYGESMTPTLTESDIVISVKTPNFKRGDIVAFYYNNHVLVKRIIASSGQTVTVASDGTVYVDGEAIDEPYISEKSFGTENDTEYPYIVPENSFFLMGDHRKESIDSRSTSIGCISADEVVGKIIFTVWPLSHFGIVS